MTPIKPFSFAAALAFVLIAALATSAPGQVPLPQRQAAQDVSAPEADELPSEELHHYAILGGVRRPGVYICVHEDLTLAELVASAGGTSPQAAGSAQVIRRGHTGPRLNCAPPSTAKLKPGDVIVVESVSTVESGWVGVALVGLQAGKPVVIQVPAPAPSVDQLLAALNQNPALVDSVRLMRTSARNVPTSEGQLGGPLTEGDIVVFDPAAIDRSALAKAESFPPPVLIPPRERPAEVKIEIHPQQRASVAGQTVLMGASDAAHNDAPGAAEVLPDEIWSLTAPPQTNREQLTSTQTSPADRETQSVADSASDSEQQRLGRQGPLPAADEEATSLEQIVEADGPRLAENSRPLLATSLVAVPNGTSGPAESASMAAATAEPQRMTAPQGGVMIALAGNDRQRSDLTQAARTSESGIVEVAALSSEIPAPSKPSAAGEAQGLGMRTLTLGITVMATVLVCFAASLLWTRLGDSTGLPAPAAGLSDENPPPHASPGRAGTLERLINNALPIIEEPTLLPEGADFHGEAVGRRRLRIDAEQNLSGPHFAAPQKAPHPVAVPETAGTANTRSNRDIPAVDAPAGDASASSSRDAAQGGLLDRVLVAMEREKRR